MRQSALARRGLRIRLMAIGVLAAGLFCLLLLRPDCFIAQGRLGADESERIASLGRRLLELDTRKFTEFSGFGERRTGGLQDPSPAGLRIEDISLEEKRMVLNHLVAGDSAFIPVKTLTEVAGFHMAAGRLPADGAELVAWLAIRQEGQAGVRAEDLIASLESTAEPTAPGDLANWLFPGICPATGQWYGGFSEAITEGYCIVVQPLTGRESLTVRRPKSAPEEQLSNPTRIFRKYGCKVYGASLERVLVNCYVEAPVKGKPWWIF